MQSRQTIGELLPIGWLATPSFDDDTADDAQLSAASSNGDAEGAFAAAIGGRVAHASISYYNRTGVGVGALQAPAPAGGSDRQCVSLAGRRGLCFGPQGQQPATALLCAQADVGTGETARCARADPLYCTCTASSKPATRHETRDETRHILTRDEQCPLSSCTLIVIAYACPALPCPALWPVLSGNVSTRLATRSLWRYLP